MAIFVDTGAWYAASVPSDPDHAAASSFMRSNTERLVTSDYIYDELLTLFRSRSHTDRALNWVNQARQDRCEIVRLTDADILDATKIFFQFADKEWSFTDCVLARSSSGIGGADFVRDFQHGFGLLLTNGRRG